MSQLQPTRYKGGFFKAGIFSRISVDGFPANVTSGCGVSGFASRAVFYRSTGVSRDVRVAMTSWWMFEASR